MSGGAEPSGLWTIKTIRIAQKPKRFTENQITYARLTKVASALPTPLQNHPSSLLNQSIHRLPVKALIIDGI